MNRLTVSLKYTLIIFSIFIFLGFGVTLLNSVSSRKLEAQRMEEEYQHFKKSHIFMIVKNLWLTDYDDLQKNIDFIQSLNYIDYIKIVDLDGDEFSSGIFTDSQTLTYTQELVYEYKDSEVKIGDVFLYFDYSSIAALLIKDFIKLFGLIILAALILSGLTGHIFSVIVGRHIKAMSDVLLQGQSEILNNKFELNRRKNSRDELALLSDSINEMRKKIGIYIKNEEDLRIKLEDDADFRKRIFSIISHDLRGPLSSFSGLTKNLLEDFDSIPGEQAIMILKEIYRSSLSLSQMTENLLDWAGSDTEHINYSPEMLSAESLISIVEEQFRGMLADKELRLSRQLLPANKAERPAVYADRKMIETVLRNLLSNAVKFTPAGGAISISAGAEDEKNTYIIIKDSGKGISEHDIEQLYKNKHIKSTRGTENEKGTGLGLSICMRFIEINGGRLLIKSSPGNGTEIRVILPSSP